VNVSDGTWPWADVPTPVADMLRPEVSRVVEEVIAAVRHGVREYARPLDGDFGRLMREGVQVALTQFVDLLGRDAQVPDLAVYRSLGKAQLRDGQTLDALQSAYRVGARTAWQHFARLVREPGSAAGDADTVSALAEAVFVYMDELADASVAGYAQEQSLLAGRAQAARHTLVELLCRWPPVPVADVARAATQAAWPVPSHLAAVAVGDADPVPLARRLPGGTIGAAVEPVAVLLVPDPEGPGRPGRLLAGLEGARAVVGPTVAWPDASRSVARAVAAWPLHAAGRLGQDSVVRTDDRLLPLLLAADPVLSSDLVRLRLGPLLAMPPAVRARAEATLRAWLDSHGDVSTAAEVLAVHPQTVRYRLGGLRDAFGDVLDDPVARLEIALALRVGDNAEDGR
jgi:hypothetical protein